MSLERFLGATSPQASVQIESLQPGRRDRPTAVTIVRWRVREDSFVEGGAELVANLASG